MLLCALGAGCAPGASRPPVDQPGAPPATTAPPPPVERPERAGPPPERAGGLDSDARGVGIRRLGRWTQSGMVAPERLVIRDAAALSALWSRLQTGEPLPAVDFERELVLAASAGQRPTGGYGIAVGRAVLEDEILRVEVLETLPSPDCMTTQQLTQPVDVVAAPAERVGEVRFAERKEVAGCGVDG